MQQHDQITIRGHAYPITDPGSPLESFWVGARKRPNFSIVSTNNFQGYVAHWEVKEEQLRITGLTGFVRPLHHSVESPGDQENPITLVDVFDGREAQFASWFTGMIVIELPDPIPGSEDEDDPHGPYRGDTGLLEVERGVVKNLLLSEHGDWRPVGFA